jgi:predicted metal-dependent HD superfamily phosphohydrolase
VSSPEAALRRCWHLLAGDGHDDTLDSILSRHREPHRRYHTAVHVMWVLRHVDDLIAASPEPIDAEVVRAAALFHDIVYDPRSSDNEHNSALLAVDALGPLGWQPQRVARVATLIEATAGHDADVIAGADGAILLDADLAILGSAPAEYRAYVTGVRAEYGHVAPDAWRTGRAAVLRSFLDRRAIYATTTMLALRERRARANLTAELVELESAPHHH